MALVALSMVMVAIAVTLFFVASVNMWWMLYAWHTPENHDGTFYLPVERETRYSFSIIVPARQEVEPVLSATVERLEAQTHPRVEIILVIAEDDVETIDVADRVAAVYPRARVVVNTGRAGTKPFQLNAALAECAGDIVGVFDAESLAATDLLVHVDEVFQARKADVVQGAVQLINYDSSWYSLRNCLEYYFWFRSRLHLHAEKNFIPLGGNTVFARRDLLGEVGGWDGHCLAEDCDLGVRLSTLGRRIAVAFDPRLVTREETPDSVYALVKQRTRWNLGFLQVYAKGEWRQLPTRRQRSLARYTLLAPVWQAFSGVVIPIAILTAIVGQFSMVTTMISFLPAVPTMAMVAFEAAALREFGRDYGFRMRIRDYARLVAGTPAYQLVLSWAAVRSVVRYFGGNFEWEKTAHVGAHLAQPSLVDEAA